MLSSSKPLFIILSVMILAALACSFSGSADPPAKTSIPTEPQVVDPVDPPAPGDDTTQATVAAGVASTQVALTVAAQLTQGAPQPGTAAPPAATTFAPPPPPFLSADGSDANGDCSCGSFSPVCLVEPSSGGNIIFGDFIRFMVLRDGVELTEFDGVERIEFTVKKVIDGTGIDQWPLVYYTDETTAAYCIFGGNGPCFSWPLEGENYTWYPGYPVTAGEVYFIEIVGTIPDCNILWNDYFTIAQR